MMNNQKLSFKKKVGYYNVKNKSQTVLGSRVIAPSILLQFD